MHPQTEEWTKLGLPFGPKPRLVLAHLNTEALRTDSPEIEIESSLTAFVKRLKLDPGGRNMRTIKDQLARLSASTVRFGLVRDGGAVTVNSQIVSAFDLWFPKDERVAPRNSSSRRRSKSSRRAPDPLHPSSPPSLPRLALGRC
jgi:hypothetical protein